MSRLKWSSQNFQNYLQDFPEGWRVGDGERNKREERRQETQFLAITKVVTNPSHFWESALDFQILFPLGFGVFFSPFNGQGLYVSLQIQGVMKLLHTSACICQRSLTSRGNEFWSLILNLHCAHLWHGLLIACAGRMLCGVSALTVKSSNPAISHSWNQWKQGILVC